MGGGKNKRKELVLRKEEGKYKIEELVLREGDGKYKIEEKEELVLSS